MECLRGGRTRVGVFSVNKMLGSLSNLGHGFCRIGSRIFREVWVSNSAWRNGGGMALGSRELPLVAFEWQRGMCLCGGERVVYSIRGVQRSSR